MNPDPLIGQELGAYRLEAVVGVGGMGVVYRAEDTQTGLPVALKVMAPELARNDSFRERFVRESESVIDHPNIVKIYEAGDSEGRLYIAMQLVEGLDLRALIDEKGRLLPAQTMSILNQAASALDAAHSNEIVHRDVKPQNILVEPSEDPSSPDGVYLTDFGLVKRLSGQTSTTRGAYLIGTAPYMAPEQIEGKSIDGRADVYAMGCVLYECLTGSTPFERDTEVAVLWAHVNDEPPSVTLRVPVLGSAVDRVIGKAMAKGLDDRYLTCGEFAEDLQTALGVSGKRARSVWASGQIARPRIRRVGTGTSAPSGTARPPSRAAAFIAGLVAAAGLAAAFASSAGPPTPAERIIDQIAQGDPDGVQAVLDEGSEPEEARRREGTPSSERRGSGDGDGPRRAGGSGSTGGPAAAADDGADREAPSPLPPTASTASIVWSVQGNEFVGSNELVADLWIMDGDGSDKRPLTDFAGGEFAPDWSPDGGQIAYAGYTESGGELWVMNADGTGARRLTSGDNPVISPEWSPDGSKILFLRCVGCPPETATSTGGDEESHVFVIDADGTNERRVTARGTRSYGATWTAGGRVLYAGWNVDYSERTDFFTVSSSGRDLREFRRDELTGIAPSSGPGGRVVFTALNPDTNDWDIYLMDRSGRRVRPLLRRAGYDIDASWSPNGRRIVFESLQGEGPSQIYSIALDGTRLRRLTDSGLDQLDPDWGPR